MTSLWQPCFRLVTLALITTVMAAAENPGGKVVLTRHALDYAAEQAITSLSGDVTGKTIPDQRGDAHVVIGKIDYEFTGMHVTSFGKPSSEVTVDPTKGITWSLQGASVAIAGNWKYTLRTIFKHSSHGTFDMSASGVGITTSVKLGEQGGKPTILSSGCSSGVGDVDVKFHGGDSWLLNLFRHNVEDAVEDQINKVLCSAVDKAINEDGAKQLAELNLTSSVGRDLMIDYSLVSPPDFNDNMVAASLKGEVFWAENRTESPLTPSPLPTGGEQMVTFILSDYIISTLGYVEQMHENVHWYLTNKDLPEEAKCALNMTCSSHCAGCLGNFFAQIKNIYPSALWELNLTSAEAPVLNITQDRLALLFFGSVDFYGRLPNGTRVPLFSSYTNATVGLTAYMEGTVIKANATKFNSVSKVTSSSPVVGPVYPEQLRTAIGVVGGAFIMPKLNSLGEKGLPLTAMRNVLYINPTLNLTDGALILSTDLKYNPTSDETDLKSTDLTLRYQFNQGKLKVKRPMKNANDPTIL